MAKKVKKRGSLGSDNIYVSVLLKLLIVLILFFLSRIVFYFFNYAYFSSPGSNEALNIFLAGLRFDVSAILILNFPFIVLNAIPLPLRQSKIWQRILNSYFYLINAIGLMGNFIDMIYFRFTLKRTTADIFNYLGVGGDFNKLIPQFLKDFWYVAVIWVVFVIILVLLGKRFNIDNSRKGVKKAGSPYYFINSVLFLITIFITIIGIRGGFQLRPLSIITAGNYTTAKNVPLLINTPFAIAKTFGKQSLKPLRFFKSEAALEKVYTPVHKVMDTTGFRPLNVMIIIMESFSAEHVGALNRDAGNNKYQGFTPFLDSLTGQGYCTMAYANGKTSIQGIPSILSAIPSLMDESYIQSGYSSDKVISIAGALKPKGYTTAFFHGGTNGTMGFDSYTRYTGFDHYYGRSEYKNEKDYDGKWGIRDEEFFQYTAGVLNSLGQPFVSALFSLSSHHPYTVPPKYAGKFRKGNLPIQESVMYADYSLKRFFETASKMKWFGNTLFVITADHTSEGYMPWYQTDAGQFSIPVIFYQPGSHLSGKPGIIAQQTDIVPTIYDLLHYDHDFLAFGSSVFDTTAPRFSIHYISGIYGLIKDGYLLEFDGMRSTALFDLKKDPLQKNNLLREKLPIRASLELFLKAYIQQYNNRMIENRLTVE